MKVSYKGFTAEEWADRFDEQRAALCAVQEALDEASAEKRKLLLQIEEQQKKTDMLYLGILGWFGYWRDQLPAKVAPSFHHAVDSIMGKRGRMSPEYINQLREMAKAMDKENSTEKRVDRCPKCDRVGDDIHAVCPACTAQEG
jgi:hypothetical protein